MDKLLIALEMTTPIPVGVPPEYQHHFELFAKAGWRYTFSGFRSWHDICSQVIDGYVGWITAIPPNATIGSRCYYSCYPGDARAYFPGHVFCLAWQPGQSYIGKHSTPDEIRAAFYECSRRLVRLMIEDMKLKPQPLEDES